MLVLRPPAALVNRVPAAILSLQHGRDPEQVAAALTALITAHPPYRRWAHVRLRSDGSADPADVAAEVARGRVLIRVELPADRPAHTGPGRR